MLEIYPSYAKDAVRLEFFGDEIERIRRFDPLTGNAVEELEFCTVYPAKYFVMPQERLRNALQLIRDELQQRYKQFSDEGKLLEAERIKTRTEYDLEMLEEMGYCSGHRELLPSLERPEGRGAARRPAGLLSRRSSLPSSTNRHVTLPQVRGMHEGDRARKLSLVKYGFRLPSALDNRPLVYNEFESLLDRVIFVSATPGEEEAAKSRQLAEQVIRPTGLLDPVLEVRPTEGQMEDLYTEIQAQAGPAREDPRDHPHQEDGGGPHGLPGRAGAEGALPALGDRNHRARGDPAGPAPGNLRRAGRHQPPARGPGPARRCR